MAKKVPTDQPPMPVNPQSGDVLPSSLIFPEFSFADFPLVISAAAAFLLFTSVSFQLGYLSAIGIGLMPFFSIQDTIVNSLSLIPTFVLILPSAILFANWMTRKPSPIAPARSIPALSPLLFATIIFLIGLIVGLTFGLFYSVYAGWMIGGALMWLSLSFFGARSRYVYPIIIFIFLTIILVLAFGYGGIQALEQLATGNYKYMLMTNEGSRCVKLLKVGSEIILIQERNGRVSIVPNSQVEMLQHVGDLPHDPLFTFDEFWSRLRGEGEKPTDGPQCLDQN